jgi:outer membrane protein OmpA-like peptidoglycan-associated protein
LENGNVGTPVNMGTVVNTEYDEQAPFYHEASKSLIFSTNGRVGMGGFDFFQSKGTIGNWATPVNLGYPVNSVKEDMYFVSRGSAKNMLEDVMLSSDRDAACCLELFALKKIRPLRQISGRIVSCDPSKPIVSSTVTVVDPATNKIVFTRVLNADGTYSFTLEDHQPLKVKAEASGFIKNEKDMQPPADMEEETLVLPDLCLTPEPPKVDEKFVVQNVYYDYDKAEVKPESYPALDEIVRMLNTYPNMEIELSAHTDSKGSDEYNQRLSEARAQSVVDYLVSKGIAKERLVAKGYGETQPVAPNTIDGKDNPEGREKNRRTEFKVLKNE